MATVPPSTSSSSSNIDIDKRTDALRKHDDEVQHPVSLTQQFIVKLRLYANLKRKKKKLQNNKLIYRTWYRHLTANDRNTCKPLFLTSQIILSRLSKHLVLFVCSIALYDRKTLNTNNDKVNNRDMNNNNTQIATPQR
jgi:hypothetical protein